MHTDGPPTGGAWITTPAERFLLVTLSPRRARVLWRHLRHREQYEPAQLVTRWIDARVADRMLRDRASRDTGQTGDALRLVCQRVVNDAGAMQETLREYGFFNAPCGHPITDACASPWTVREWCATCAAETDHE